MKSYCLKCDKVIDSEPLVRAVLDTAQARGASRQRLLRGTGIFEEDLGAGYLISPEQLLALLSNAQAQSRGSDTGFQIGKSLASSHLGAMPQALSACRSLTDVMRMSQGARWTLSPFISFHRFYSGDDVLFVLEDAIGCGKSWPFILELYLSMWVALSKHWCGQRQPFHFTFASPRPRHIQEYEANLGHRISFGAPLHTVRICRRRMISPFPKYDATGRAALRATLSACTIPPVSLLDSIRGAVRDATPVSLDDIAASRHISIATLKRRLKEHQTSFRELVDETRREQVIYLLAVQKYTNEKSALSMAFSDLTNFRRAVKRWTGLTPSQLRQV